MKNPKKTEACVYCAMNGNRLCMHTNKAKARAAYFIFGIQRNALNHAIDDLLSSEPPELSEATKQWAYGVLTDHLQRAMNHQAKITGAHHE